MSRRGGTPVIRGALLFALLLGSLTVVVWRQGQALAVLRELDAVRKERVVEEAHRASLVRRIEALESRGRVTADAGARFDMRVPTGGELVFLSLRSPASGLAATDPAGPDRAPGDGGDEG